MSWKFVSKVRINNIPALVQIMAWRLLGDKSLSEPVMIKLLTYIRVSHITERRHGASDNLYTYANIVVNVGDTEIPSVLISHITWRPNGPGLTTNKHKTKNLRYKR